MSAAWVFDDGGRSAAGISGTGGDCAVRAVAIATGLPYAEVADIVRAYAARERPRSRAAALSTGRPIRRRSNPRTGVHRATMRRLLADLGWDWTPTMRVGAGCEVHLRAEELPAGRLIAQVSRHFVAVVDGVVRDNHDPTRGGTRCVYGFWTPPGAPPPRGGAAASGRGGALVTRRPDLQRAVLAFMREDGGTVTPAEVAAHVGTTPTGATRVLRTLKERGLVRQLGIYRWVTDPPCPACEEGGRRHTCALAGPAERLL